MELTTEIPLEGTWSVAGSERDYDWIGPQSTLPGAGRMFEAFDAVFPFTRLIRAIRRLFGLGSDEFTGPYEVKVNDCGATIEAFGRTFTREGNRYVNLTDIEGTMHHFVLEVASPTSMTGRFTFGIGNITATMTPDQLAGLQSAGVSADELVNLKMESDAPMAWSYAGSSEEEEEARRKQNACLCKKTFRSALMSRILAEAFGNSELRLRGIAEGWTADDYERAMIGEYDIVVDYMKPLLSGGDPDVTLGAYQRGIVSLANPQTRNRKAIASVAHNDPSQVAIDKEQFNALTPAAQKAVAIHETVHQAQLFGRFTVAVATETAEEQSGEMVLGDAEWHYDAKMSDVWDKGLRESEAYEAGLDYLLDWLDENCKDCDDCANWRPERIPALDRSLLTEAKQSVGGAIDVEIVEDPMG